MFTGLIEKVGSLARLGASSGGGALTVRHTPWSSPLVIGESVAVQGACLTVTSAGLEEFTADVLDETLVRTNLGRTAVGARLNLERALQLRDRIGGHLVSGHVDGVGTVAGVRPAGRDRVLEIEAGVDLLGEVVQKGSIACDGVSLTVARVTDRSFDVHIIPHTWDNTSLCLLQAGDTVNLETDLIAKYVVRYLQGTARAPRGVSMGDLQRAGFV
jgi:riboflavin synthase